MLFLSPSAGLIVQLRNAQYDYSQGFPLETVPGIAADFGLGFSGEWDEMIDHWSDTDGGPKSRAEIRGGAFDTDEAAERLGWSEEEKAFVERKMLHILSQSGTHKGFYLYEPPKASKPWPSYDETPPEQIADIAVAIGALDGTLAFERENANRPKVIKDLEAERSRRVDEEALTAT